MKHFHLTLCSRSVFFKNWGGPRATDICPISLRHDLLEHLFNGSVFSPNPRGGGAIPDVEEGAELSDGAEFMTTSITLRFNSSPGQLEPFSLSLSASRSLLPLSLALYISTSLHISLYPLPANLPINQLIYVHTHIRVYIYIYFTFARPFNLAFQTL